MPTTASSPIANAPWGTVAQAAYGRTAASPHRVWATPRLHGALRYQCPVTDSFVLVSDDATLTKLARAHGRIRCVDCGEDHLVTHEPRGR